MWIASTVLPLQANKLSINVVLSIFGNSLESMFKSSMVILDFSSAEMSSFSSVFESFVGIAGSSDMFSIWLAVVLLPEREKRYKNERTYIMECMYFNLVFKVIIR